MKELNRKVCIANNSNECIKTLCNFNIKSTSYATKGENFVYLIQL